MLTVRSQLALAGLLAFVRLGNCVPVPSTVSQLVESNKSDKFGLVAYFKELGLNDVCDVQLADDAAFKTFADDVGGRASRLCTVIYRMTEELDKSNSTNGMDLESAKRIPIKFNNTRVYDMWKRVTEVSPSLKLLVDSSIDNITKWNAVCYNERAVTGYCRFLNVEVLLLFNTLQNPKESLKKENSVNQPVLKEPEVQKPSVNDVQKEMAKNNDEDLVEADTVKEPETVSGDDDSSQPEKQTDVQIPSETDSIDYPKEYDGVLITQTVNSMAKENRLPYSQKSFTNRRYSAADDSHFLFYFGVMTVISMLFYLALYNKKKIIALVIEGRKGSNHRRRPNTATYSKVETDDGSNVF